MGAAELRGAGQQTDGNARAHAGRAEGGPAVPRSTGYDGPERELALFGDH